MPEVDDHYKVSEAFARFGWKNIVNLSRHYYSNMVRDFYANVEDKHRYSGNQIISWVCGTRLVIEQETITKYIKVKNDGINVKLTKEF